jgi:hypothetical protein
MWSDDHMAMACSGHVAITILRQPVTAALLRRVRTDMTLLKARCSGKLVSFTVLESGAVKDTPEDVRTEAMNLMRDGHVFAAAIVIEGKGFRLSTARALLAGLGLISKPRYAQRIFEHVDTAAEWVLLMMADKGIRTKGKQDLIALVESARASIGSKDQRFIRT